MRIGHLIVGFAAGACTVLAAATLAPQDAGTSMQDMEKAWQEYMVKYATPGKEHAQLARRVGQWEAKVSSWYAPDAEPTVMNGSSSFEMIMDGRYLMQEFKGTFEGMPFTGAGLTAFDRQKEQYSSIWIDSMSTGLMISTGTDRDGAVDYWGEMPDPMTGGTTMTRMIERMDGDDRIVFDMFAPTKDGSMYRSMQMIYTRVKEHAAR